MITTDPLAFRGNTPQSCRLAEPDKLRVASRSTRSRTLYTRAKSLCQGEKVRNYLATAPTQSEETHNFSFASLREGIGSGHIVPSASTSGTNVIREKREKAEKNPSLAFAPTCAPKMRPRAPTRSYPNQRRMPQPPRAWATKAGRQVWLWRALPRSSRSESRLRFPSLPRAERQGLR